MFGDSNSMSFKSIVLTALVSVLVVSGTGYLYLNSDLVEESVDYVESEAEGKEKNPESGDIPENMAEGGMTGSDELMEMFGHEESRSSEPDMSDDITSENPVHCVAK